MVSVSVFATAAYFLRFCRIPCCNAMASEIRGTHHKLYSKVWVQCHEVSIYNTAWTRERSWWLRSSWEEAQTSRKLYLGFLCSRINRLKIHTIMEAPCVHYDNNSKDFVAIKIKWIIRKTAFFAGWVMNDRLMRQFDHSHEIYPRGS